MADGISGTGVAAAGIGMLFLWSAIKGASISETFRELVTGQQPKGVNINAIGQTEYAKAPAALTGAPLAQANANAALIIATAASRKGQGYAFGAGHTNNPCASKKTDCSSYVSCVLNKVGLMKGSLATGGFASFGVKVPYANRAPGDLIVWNGGTGGGHIGIIVDANHMWHNPCTACGGVQLGKYPYGSRTAASANVRRVIK
jgi:cell wall-associated NlpC family hydrolase